VISFIAASTHDQDVFSFYPDVRFCNGLEDVLSRYREVTFYLIFFFLRILYYIFLSLIIKYDILLFSGPTSFAPVIEMAMTIVEQSGGQYHILVIIADGQVFDYLPYRVLLISIMFFNQVQTVYSPNNG
jgi:E3 ubiquitin-protein ligase RGLG